MDLKQIRTPSLANAPQRSLYLGVESAGLSPAAEVSVAEDSASEVSAAEILDAEIPGAEASAERCSFGALGGFGKNFVDSTPKIAAGTKKIKVPLRPNTAIEPVASKGPSVNPRLPPNENIPRENPILSSSAYLLTS